MCSIVASPFSTHGFSERAAGNLLSAVSITDAGERHVQTVSAHRKQEDKISPVKNADDAVLISVVVITHCSLQYLLFCTHVIGKASLCRFSPWALTVKNWNQEVGDLSSVHIHLGPLPKK